MDEFKHHHQTEPSPPAYAQAPTDPYQNPPPPAEPPPPYHGAAPPFRPTSALAVWSLVNGILGWLLCPVICSMIAVVTGHMALNEINRLDLDGKGLAIAGLILGYSMLAVGLLAMLGIAMLMVFAGTMTP